MSETQLADEPARRGPGRPRKDDARLEEAETQRKEDVIPPGFDACFIAVPNKVSKGDGTKGAPGEKVIGPKKSVDELELRGLAFRDPNEAKAAYTTWRRKREADIEARIEAERKREENRLRWKKAMEADSVPEWQA